MRKEPFTVGSMVHVTKRGARGIEIVRDDADRWRFLRLLRYFNDENIPRQWERDLDQQLLKDNFMRPDSWEPQEPLVRIVAFCLLDNHFHLLFEEVKECGIERFMKRLGDSMVGHFNNKYKEKGSLFQGPYHARTITSTEDLLNVVAYIQVKNVFDCVGWNHLQQGAYEKAIDHAARYVFSSLPDYLRKRSYPIIQNSVVTEVWDSAEKCKMFAQDFLEHHTYEQYIPHT